MYIDSIQLMYQLPSGEDYVGTRFGGRGELHTIDLDVDGGERINGIFGRSGALIDQLGFVTNKGRMFGPYGGCGGSEFTVNDCEIRGIFGRSGALIDSIGFHCAGSLDYVI